MIEKVHSVYNQPSVYNQGGYGDTPVIVANDYFLTTIIGDKLWTVENLDITWPGLVVGGSSSNSEPRANYYNNNKDEFGRNGKRFGLLYNWFAVKYIIDNIVLTDGWRIPNEYDVQDLINFQSADLKSTFFWSSNNGNGNTDLRILPTGSMYNNQFTRLGTDCYIWSSKEISSTVAAGLRINNAGIITYDENYAKSSSCVIRVCKDV